MVFGKPMGIVTHFFTNISVAIVKFKQKDSGRSEAPL